MPTVRAREWAIISLISVVIVAATTIPYVYGYLKTPPETKFMGLVAGIADANAYFMWMNQMDSGGILASNYFSLDRGEPAYLNLLWLILGKLHALTGLPLITLYQMARISGGIILLLVSYKFIARFFDERDKRITAFLFVSVGSGFGWLFMLHAHIAKRILLYPVDLASPDATMFFTILCFPHLIVSLTLILLTYLAMLKALEENRWSLSLLGGTACLALGFVHGFDVVPVHATILTYSILLMLRKDFEISKIKHYATLLVFTLPVLVYFYLLTRHHPDYFGRTPQPPFPLLVCALGFGFPLFLAFLSLCGLLDLKQRSRQYLFLVSWLVPNAVLLYSYPLIRFSGRFLLGIQIPMSLLATEVFFRYVVDKVRGSGHQPSERSLIRFLQRWPRGLMIAAAMCLLIPTNVYIVWDRMQRTQYGFPFYLSYTQLQAFDYLEHHSSPDDVILSSYNIGHYIARLSRRRPFIGHWYHTPDLDEKQRLASAFFNRQTTDAARLSFLDRYGITMLYYGEFERASGRFNPDRASYLTKLFDNEDVRLYEVTR